MNTKVLGGVVVGFVALGVALFLLRSAPAVAPANTTSLSPIASTTQNQAVSTPKSPSITAGTPTAKPASPLAYIDSISLVSTSTYPTIVGTANVSKVGIIITDSKDVGIVGTGEIRVTTQGHWSYTCSVALQPGSYSILLLIGDRVTQTAKLTVLKP